MSEAGDYARARALTPASFTGKEHRDPGGNPIDPFLAEVTEAGGLRLVCGRSDLDADEMQRFIKWQRDTFEDKATRA